jgi:hypothetical protein
MQITHGGVVQFKDVKTVFYSKDKKSIQNEE